MTLNHSLRSKTNPTVDIKRYLFPYFKPTNPNSNFFSNFRLYLSTSLSLSLQTPPNLDLPPLLRSLRHHSTTKTTPSAPSPRRHAAISDEQPSPSPLPSPPYAPPAPTPGESSRCSDGQPPPFSSSTGEHRRHRWRRPAKPPRRRSILQSPSFSPPVNVQQQRQSLESSPIAIPPANPFGIPTMQPFLIENEESVFRGQSAC
ncbi:proline-rich receptor-like protein kinase PERK10 isoform X2 [Capsicum annuum]|uniref:proline-rich receptor-like protein kinase PERK10 isoform X2 n=1 Tax=Capsicum annuum TaxID=4072 RepID=UPI001FB12F9E|nr:proline-rich receptor-like protein kinase PERK10 isoform X2 [Capsicum annuum]